MSIDEKVLKQVKVGQNLKISYRIHEGGKTRTQPYDGTVIAMKGSGISRTFTVRHAGVDNIGVERIFPLYSPNIEKVEIISKGKYRRAKLYYIRRLSSKAVRKLEKE